MSKKIAIIGAGISGLVLAHELNDYASVTVFEKARGVGGRMATRYAEPYAFDHGTACFTARTDEFKHFINPFINQNLIAKWDAQVLTLKPGSKPVTRTRLEEHLVASPNMNSLCKYLAKDLNIILNTQVYPLEKRSNDKKWPLFASNGNSLGDYDLVISTAPAEQTKVLFSSYLHYDCPLLNTSMQACFALMLGFNQPWNLAWNQAKVQNSPLKSIFINSSKPGRNNLVTAVVAHTTSKWSTQHLDFNLDQLEILLTQEFLMLADLKTAQPCFSAIHLWRYALVDKVVNGCPYLDPHLQLAAVSDWSAGSRIEDVYLKAVLLGKNIKKELL